ncbi:MAG: RNA polymerase sigma factor [Saprospiraceae bacterium]|nr:RNA polymerase sigma factor [Saprospiraceae bacterium]
MTDEAIMAMATRPDTRNEGFRQLVITYQQRLYHVIRRQVTSHEDADDILQNTFIKVFRYLNGFENRSELYTWLYRIASNEVINHLKRSKRTRVEELTGNDSRYSDSYINTDGLSETLETIICTLPERQQMVFRMRYYDELSYKEIAALLHLTEGALKASYHHAVKKIEVELKAKQIV